jgi:hypothetical protein
VTKETKFNYGLLSVGLALPIIAEYFLGRACGVIVAIVVLVVGAMLLVSGHTHSEAGMAVSRKRKLAAYAVGGAFLSLGVMGMRVVYTREFGKRPLSTLGRAETKQSTPAAPESNNPPSNPSAVKSKNEQEKRTAHATVPPAPHDNSVHIGEGAKVEQESKGPCSPNIIGGNSTVNCSPTPTIQSVMLVARWTCTVRGDVERPLLSDRAFMMGGSVRAALFRKGQPQVWFNLQSPLHQEETNGQLDITGRYLLLQDSGWIGRPIDSLPTEVDAVVAAVFFATLKDCTENTSSANSMTISMNGTEVWHSRTISAENDADGNPMITAKVESWPDKDQLVKALSH